MSTYKTIYVDNEGNHFVGEDWVAATQEEFDQRVEAEHKVIEEIPVIDSVLITEIVDTLVR